jgi:hypothetical protein
LELGETRKSLRKAPYSIASETQLFKLGQRAKVFQPEAVLGRVQELQPREECEVLGHHCAQRTVRQDHHAGVLGKAHARRL